MKKIPNISYTTTNDLCTGCGICVGVCPTQSIVTTIKNGRFIPKVEESTCINTKGCHKCYDVCPGLGIDFLNLYDECFKNIIHQDPIIGPYDACFTGHSTNEELRYHGASGGMVTQMLIWLLNTGKIDGAIVTKFDNSQPLMIKTILATKEEDIIQAKGSKYAPVTFDSVSSIIKNAEGSRYIIVGQPCHIQGLRKQIRKDSALRNKIIAIWGIYCSSGRTFNLTEYIMRERNIPREKLTYFAYRDEGCLGSMVAAWTDPKATHPSKKYTEPYRSYFHPLRSFFIPKRCLFCFDHYASLADISFGDIHIKPYSEDKIGINSVISRTPIMTKWLREAQKDGAITLDLLDVDLLRKSQVMAKRKYNRIGAFIKIAKLFGSKTPSYDINLPTKKTLRNSLDYIQTRIQQFIGTNKILWNLIPLLKSKPKLH